MTIHERLCADAHILGRFQHSTVLLHRNAHVPWLMLVPECDETEFLALATGLREQLLDESARLAAFVQAHFGSPKINFAAIGNIVPQLHLHVVGRDPGDICWPAPVWGHVPETKSYSEADVNLAIAVLREQYALRPFVPDTEV